MLGVIVMRKSISIIIAVILIVGCFTYPASALERKLDDRSLELLAQADPDDIVTVEVWFAYPWFIPDFTIADYGDDYEAYWRDYNELSSTYYTEKNQQTAETLSSQLDIVVEYLSNIEPAALISLKARDIAALEEQEIVAIIYLLSDMPPFNTDNRFAFECHRFLMRHGSEGAEYRELYYHYTADDTVDWALVYFLASPAADECISVIFADRIILEAVQSAVFLGGYGVYDVAADNFYTLHSLRDEPDRYPGLVEAVWEQKVGRPLGDADGDNELTILDATRIQRVLAGLAETDIEIEAIWNFIDSYEAHANVCPCGFSDADKDGEVTILDATRIQRKLAGLVN